MDFFLTGQPPHCLYWGFWERNLAVSWPWLAVAETLLFPGMMPATGLALQEITPTIVMTDLRMVREGKSVVESIWLAFSFHSESVIALRDGDKHVFEPCN